MQVTRGAVKRAFGNPKDADFPPSDAVSPAVSAVPSPKAGSFPLVPPPTAISGWAGRSSSLSEKAVGGMV